jgi:tRNA A37 threonylcarbamoyladenosine synthetase subunit TsaC/SUA5/YrdC
MPSTIVDLTDVSPKILREGAVSAEQIAEVIGTGVESLRA